MNAIIGITSLVRHDAADKGKVIEYADKIDISSQHLLGIINDVLDTVSYTHLDVYKRQYIYFHYIQYEYFH